MFARFNHRWFQSLKLSKPKAGMILERLVEVLDSVAGVIFKFLGGKVCEFYTVYGR